MGILTKLDNGLQAFKSAFLSAEIPPLYARLDDGTHTYNYETERFGLLGMLGMGQAYGRPKENLKYFYANTVFLQDCINLYADLASQVKLMEVDKDGNEIEDSEYINFLKNPNPFQTKTEFIKEMVINLLSTGAVFQYGNFFKNGNMRLAPRLYNLDYNSLSFPEIKNRYLLKEKDIQNLVIKEHLADSKTRDISLFELAFFYDTIPNNGFSFDNKYDAKGFFKPMSRMFSILPSINTLLNSQASMEFMAGNNVNFILSKKTGKGDYAPLENDQKIDIERKVNGRSKYGTKSGKEGGIIATNESLDLLDLTRDNRKMQMIEMKESAKEDVRNCYLIPKDFFGDSTYENKQFSEARLIIGSVATITDNMCNELTNKTPLYFEARGTRLVGTYDHLPSVAETKQKLQNESFLMQTQALTSAIGTYGTYKEVVEENISWKEFLRINKFNDYLMIQS